MLLYLFRALAIGLSSWLRAPTRPFEPTVQRFRAWPWYCDQNLHVNNAHYLTFMDFGRIGWLGASRFIDRVRAERLRLLVAGSGVTYRREIRLLATFELETRLVAVEGRWLYFRQTFRTRGQVAAQGLVRVAAQTSGGLADLSGGWPDPLPPIDADLRQAIEGLDAQVRSTNAA